MNIREPSGASKAQAGFLESFATRFLPGNPVVSFCSLEKSHFAHPPTTPGKDIDMNNSDPDNGVPRPNGWGRSHQVFGSAWLHSDMKDVAYFYVYKLYEQLIEKGNLK